MRSSIEEIPVDSIIVSNFNPRKNFDLEYIEKLAESIREDGQWDPIIVRKRPDGYELIAGECRFRAAKKLGLRTILARIVDLNDSEAILLALKTNLMRRDLNPVEEAFGIKALIDRGWSLHKISKLIGKSLSWVRMRLKLAENASEGIKNAIVKGELDLLAAVKISELSEALQGPVADKAIREKLSLKEVENLVELLKKAKENEIELLLRRPVKDYMRSPPYNKKKASTSKNSKKSTLSLIRCECGALFIIDWTNRRVISEKVVVNNGSN